MPVGQTALNTCLVLTNLSTAQYRSSSSTHLSSNYSLSVEAAVQTSNMELLAGLTSRAAIVPSTSLWNWKLFGEISSGGLN
jgi:hypothetical protein